MPLEYLICCSLFSFLSAKAGIRLLTWVQKLRKELVRGIRGANVFFVSYLYLYLYNHICICSCSKSVFGMPPSLPGGRRRLGWAHTQRLWGPAALISAPYWYTCRNSISSAFVFAFVFMYCKAFSSQKIESCLSRETQEGQYVSLSYGKMFWDTPGLHDWVCSSNWYPHGYTWVHILEDLSMGRCTCLSMGTHTYMPIHGSTHTSSSECNYAYDQVRHTSYTWA